ncbi:MAG TPA: TIGR01777 family oxidoreductase [Spirochaetota bacterium]|nr:TIGR01777 family oxidoreductase [Spirochaetota bacterium]HOD14654.1 TIGR01777 family oxidoreductase [Spirochaetota bacterium]HPG51823.1 TIGR01777 family oxidoreductase [Spirochaetota bacterium]HPN12582.1 TIGR01777 family oxidoreductase [Spirochaetota bacterium]HQL82953.1 TIGR01777 family oxidoreductase [Spirochaetota bacterium]
MKADRFLKRSVFPVPAERLFAWHMRPGALQRLAPPWEWVEVLEEAPPGEGSRAVFRIKAGPFRIKWTAVHSGIVPGREFIDTQLRGPFSFWRHTHRFITEDASSCSLVDEILYRQRGGPAGRMLLGGFTRKKLARMFEYRHRIIREDLASTVRKPSTIVVTGASGLIGHSLVPYLTTRGHTVTRLVRGTPLRRDEARWDPDRGSLDFSLENNDAVIHLAGEPIGTGRWSAGKKSGIISSRVRGTRLIAEQCAACKNPPATLLCASAVGFYGDRGDTLLTENDSRGHDFISGVCAAWEAAARPAIERGIRVVLMRIGVVLHPQGGALGHYLTPARLGLGGIIGSGSQYISWISIDDMIGAIEHLLFNTTVSGPLNIAAPEPARNREFVATLAGALGRPAVFSLPACLVRRAFGQMGREVLLSSTRVSAQKLVDSGYTFRHGSLDGALCYLLGRESTSD